MGGQSLARFVRKESEDEKSHLWLILFGRLHAKDISVAQGSAERGRVTGTPVGCACGDGVVNWLGVIEICRGAKRDIVLSVECGTIEQAARSIVYLKNLLARA